MKYFIKRIIAAFLLGAVCMGGAVYASDSDNTDEQSNLVAADGETDNKNYRMPKFEITYFYGPHNEQLIDESFYEKIAEAGFTSIPLEYGNTEYNTKALPMLRKYVLTCSALSDARIDNVIGLDRSFSPDTPQEEVDRIISEVVADYADYMDVIEGWLLQDEPSEVRFEILGKVVKAFRKYSPEKSTMINLFPVYADSAALGTPTYQDYLDEFVKQVDPHYLSYDHYHFFADGTVRNDFFENLEKVRDTAKESGIDPMIIILLTTHMNYANVTPDQIEWEVNTSLTYGMKRISYFTFILEQYLLDAGWTNACMSYTGEIWPHYYDVQKINKWLLPLGEELFDKESTAVFHMPRFTGNKGETVALEVGCERYTPYGDLGKAYGQDFVIGFFDDGSFMITNKKWNEFQGTHNNFVFADIESGLEYFNPEKGAWCDAEADGIVTRNYYGQLSRKFDLGEGILFRVSK